MIGGTLKGSRREMIRILLLSCGGGEKHSNEHWIYEHGNIFFFYVFGWFFFPFASMSMTKLRVSSSDSSYHGKLIQYILLNLCHEERKDLKYRKRL